MHAATKQLVQHQQRQKYLLSTWRPQQRRQRIFLHQRLSSSPGRLQHLTVLGRTRKQRLGPARALFALHRLTNHDVAREHDARLAPRLPLHLPAAADAIALPRDACAAVVCVFGVGLEQQADVCVRGVAARLAGPRALPAVRAVQVRPDQGAHARDAGCQLCWAGAGRAPGRQGVRPSNSRDVGSDPRERTEREDDTAVDADGDGGRGRGEVGAADELDPASDAQEADVGVVVPRELEQQPALECRTDVLGAAGRMSARGVRWRALVGVRWRARLDGQTVLRCWVEEEVRLGERVAGGGCKRSAF
mmetsp:Transcript_6977/g.13842  ORF Transcript_6977/g.13842 Transcript_6977/m.13842 type:complete len:305 (+) Transcript_6977:778-1692(+)